MDVDDYNFIHTTYLGLSFQKNKKLVGEIR
jgi:hypothetical protein